ncbi:MAG: 16S rRNA (uracil(1498)-N(3))-methyltransferase [Nitrospirota bacterium]
MNLIILFETDFIDTNRVRLGGRRFRHVLEIHRARAGDELTVGLLNGGIGAGRITFLDEGRLEMEVSLDREPPLPLPVTLVLALPRPKVLKRVLIATSSMGVKRIYLINAFRVEKSFWKSPVLYSESINEQLVLGLEQARDTLLPDVVLKPLFKLFVEDELPGIMEGTLRLVAHPHAAEPCPCAVARQVTLAVGPEGGFIPYEIERLKECGFRPVYLGERILRTETAVSALLAKLF